MRSEMDEKQFERCSGCHECLEDGEPTLDHEGEVYCQYCVQEEAEVWLKGFEDTEDDIWIVDPSEHGYQLVDVSREATMAPLSVPADILRKMHFERFVFSRWSVYLHNEEANFDEGMGLARALTALENGVPGKPWHFEHPEDV